MTRETKFISFSEFKQITDGAGGFEGYISKWGELDDGGDIVAQGAHVDTIPDFLKRGFGTDSHDWSFGSGMVGYPVSAKEDQIGTYARFNFHSTPDAQNVRIKANERLAAGMDVPMSIGYQPSVPPLFIEPKDYATEIPKYSRPGLEDQNLLKALRFPVVRVLLKNTLFEGAIVTVPMLGSAMVTAVKSAETGTLGTELPFAAHVKWLGTALGAFMDRTDRVLEMDTKEGRVLSGANWDELTAIYERLGKLLDAAKPKPKEQDTEKSIDVNAVMNYLRVIDLQLRGVPIK